MDNELKLKIGRRLSLNKTGQDFYKISDLLLSSLDDFTNSNNQLSQQGKDFNILQAYYNKKFGNGNFIDKISRLNKRFYNCSDKFVKSKKILDKLNDDLFLNLFQQINCYVEEIERLNKKISSNNNQELKKTIDQLNKEISEKKEKIRHYENKIREKTLNEEKLMKEIESYKRSITFYKDKIKIGLLVRNRNCINSIGRENSTNFGEKKSIGSRKSQTKCHSPTPRKKVKSFGNKIKNNNKDLILKLDEDINNIRKESEELEKNQNPKTKSYDREHNYIANRTDYDIYGKDIEEKDDVYNSRNKDINKQSTNDQFTKTYSGLFNVLSKELYGSQDFANNTIESEIVGSEYFNKNSSSERAFDKKDNEKNVHKNNKDKDRTATHKSKNTNKFSNKKDSVKSKILCKNTHNNNKNNKNNTIKTETINTNKTKQIKTTTKSMQKNTYKSSDKIPNNQKEKTKDKKTNFKPGSGLNLKYSVKTTTSYQKKGNSNINNEINNLGNNYLKTLETNDYIRISKKSTNLNNYDGYKSSSNINSSRRDKYNNITTKFNGPKILNEKDNKELYSILMDVNDDYSKSIEMLRKQEDLIKHLLKDINFDEN